MVLATMYSIYTLVMSLNNTFNFPSLASMQSYAADMKAKSLYDTGVDISSASQVVTLSTCTDNGEKRFIVHGMYIGEASLE